MCTLTVLPLADARSRLAFNRDEQRSRPVGLPPQWRRHGDHSALFPVDPVSDGTWIAVNDAGLVLALLNAMPTTAVPSRGRSPETSRGTIIPGLLACSDLNGAFQRALKLHPASYAPFRLVLIHDAAIAEVGSDGRLLTSEGPTTLTTPRLFTSSGLGDELVAAPRGRLFEEYVAGDADLAARQDAFHRHVWPEWPHLSVCMSRPDARTVSLTVVDLAVAGGVMTYFPDAPDRPAQPATERITFCQGVPR